jgi:hypothetical protein
VAAGRVLYGQDALAVLPPTLFTSAHRSSLPAPSTDVQTGVGCVPVFASRVRVVKSAIGVP